MINTDRPKSCRLLWQSLHTGYDASNKKRKKEMSQCLYTAQFTDLSSKSYRLAQRMAVSWYHWSEAEF